MTFDPDIANVLDYHKSRHEDADHETDMKRLANKLGYGYKLGGQSLLGPNGAIYIERTLSKMDARAEAAHELSHALTREGYPTYEDVIRHRHASVPDLEGHIERLADLGGDALLMPDRMVQTVLAIGGLNARAVWLLHQTAEAPPETALRRLVTHNENARLGGFIARADVIHHAESYRWHMPCWIGDPVPDVYDGFCGDAVSLFKVPGRRNTVIGLIVIEEG